MWNAKGIIMSAKINFKSKKIMPYKDRREER